MTVQREIVSVGSSKARLPDRNTDRPLAKPCVGDWVEVRSQSEILATLDQRGELDSLPFMPEMLQYCGRRFRVFRRAHKTCDTATGFATGRWIGVRLENVVHLDLRCDGSAHGGCQAACLLFWKEAWLKAVDPEAPVVQQRAAPRRGCTKEQLLQAAQLPSEKPNQLRFSCQATRVPEFSRSLSRWDPRQYLEDYRSGNVSLSKLLHGATFAAYVHLTQAERRTLGRPGRWLYDRFQKVRGGIPFPRRNGTLPPGQVAPVVDLGLKPGDWVRVKSYEAILATVDESGLNNNLSFDAEMVPYCGGVYRVRTRVERFVDESTGYLRTMRTPAVMLDKVTCASCYSGHRMLCPRSIYSWWREAWLERVEGPEQ